MVIQIWVLDKLSLENECSESVASKKTTNSICCQW